MARRACAAHYNIVAGGYTNQRWTGYPDSPNQLEWVGWVSSALYPIQILGHVVNGLGVETIVLFMASAHIYHVMPGHQYYRNPYPPSSAIYSLSGGAWVDFSFGNGVQLIDYMDGGADGIWQANHDVYTDDTETAIHFAKTTTPDQDIIVTTQLMRIRMASYRIEV